MNSRIDNDKGVIVTFTGNRSIGMNNPTVMESLMEIHRRFPGATWRSGMAVGLDLAAAQFAYTHNIPFEAHLPFPAFIQTKRWQGTAVQLHTMLLTKAVKVFTYSKEFSMDAYQARNVGMATGADVVVAFNLHTKGGTANMIWHCLSQGIEVLDGFDDLKVMKGVN